jgi:hypothetical protein
VTGEFEHLGSVTKRQYLRITVASMQSPGYLNAHAAQNAKIQPLEGVV